MFVVIFWKLCAGNWIIRFFFKIFGKYFFRTPLIHTIEEIIKPILYQTAVLSAAAICLVTLVSMFWHITHCQVLVYYTEYTRKHARSIMEIRYRLMSNILTNRYQILEAERSSHLLRWYIPFQVSSSRMISEYNSGKYNHHHYYSRYFDQSNRVDSYSPIFSLLFTDIVHFRWIESEEEICWVFQINPIE